MNFSGQYTFSQEEGTIELDYGKNEKLKGVSLKTDVSVSRNSMQLLFNADKLLDFISKISFHGRRFEDRGPDFSHRPV